jgi:sulfatase maturation enzyme AslB (radical SAM superfamily)
MKETIHFSSLTACLDMAGCPNRCKHCWLGVAQNGHLTEADLRFVAAAFRPFTDRLSVDSGYREPDYLPEYKRLWAVERELSDVRPVPHWELMSVWRAVRDADYVSWLKSLGIKACQLTLFGGREKTDFYTGRRGAYDEIVEAIELLIKEGIAPRIQVFINQDNLDDLGAVVDLIQEKQLIQRCPGFSAFVHQGSCDGENAKLYDVRVTPPDLSRVPQLLIDYSLRHWKVSRFEDIFGQTERVLCESLADSGEIIGRTSDTPVFFVDKDFNVYPNVTTPTADWRLGNLKKESAEEILRRYRNNESPAQRVRATVPLGEMIRACGHPESERLFTKGDYYDPLVHAYCKRGA